MSFKRNYLRLLAFSESCSLLGLLFIATLLRKFGDHPHIVKTMGAFHGALFLMLVYSLFSYAYESSWPKRRVMLGIVVMSLPFGGFWFDRKYLSHQ